MSEVHGRYTGIRQHGRLFLQYQGNGILEAPLEEDLSEALLVALKSRTVRRHVAELLSKHELDTLRFVERARELRTLTKTHETERALRLASVIYKRHLRSGNKLDGIGQQDRTAATAAVWDRARKNSEQLRSYEVLEEVVEVATQKAHLLGLSLLPKMVAAVDFDALTEAVEASDDPEHTVQALTHLRKVKNMAPGSWLQMFRTVVDKLKAAVVLSDMTLPGAPMICVNATFCAITGYGREEAEGRNCRFLQGPATRLEALRVIQRTLAQKKDCQVTIHNYRKNGQIFQNLLSMRPVLDIEGKYTYVVAVQFEVDENCMLAQQRKLRMLSDLLEMLPKYLPFKQIRMRDRATPILPVVRVRFEGDAALEKAAVRRVVFWMTRLKWLTNPVAVMRRLVGIPKLQDRLRVLAASNASGGSAVAVHALELATHNDTPEVARDAATSILAHSLLPALATSSSGFDWAEDIVCRPPFACGGNDEERIADTFVHCFREAAREAPVSCILVDMREPGLPIAFANDRFVRLAGLSSEAEAVGQNCRFLQGNLTQPYLIEEISSAIRERRGVVVKLLNYSKGKPFQCLVALHPVFATVGGDYMYQIGAQVNMSNDEDLETRLAELELFVAMLPQTVDGSADNDKARLPKAQDKATSSFVPEAKEPQAAPPPLTGGVVWDDMPAAGGLDPSSRLAIEESCLDAILKFTLIKWLQSPEVTTSALLRSSGACHDAFSAFASKRSSVARKLIECWDIIEEISQAGTVTEQKSLALKHHTVWRENPLFLFARTEIPVGNLGDLKFDWDPILKTLPRVQARCTKVLSIHVLRAFLAADAGRALMRYLLGHDGDIPEVDADLYTAGHHPHVGAPILTVGNASGHAEFWLEMAWNLVGDDDSKSFREKDRIQSLNGAVLALDKPMPSPATSSWLSSLVNAFGNAVVDDVTRSLNSSEPRCAVIASGRSLLFVQPVLGDDKKPAYFVVFSIDNTRDDKYVTAVHTVALFLRYAPQTVTGRVRGDASLHETPSLEDLWRFRVPSNEAPPLLLDEVQDDDATKELVTSPAIQLFRSFSTTQRPTTAPASRSVASHAPADLGSLFSEAGENSSGAVLKNNAAQCLITKIKNKLDGYVHERRLNHEASLNRGDALDGEAAGILDNNANAKAPSFDGRSVSQLSTTQKMRSLIQERQALWRDGLMEKALELDAPIAQVKEDYKKQRNAKLTRVLANTRTKLEHQHQRRLRTLAAQHRQELMTLDKQIQEGITRLKEQHQAQSEAYVNEIMCKTGANKPATAEATDDPQGAKPYLQRQMRFQIRTTTRPPEMVYQLKMAKHLRRKKRHAEADDAERKARDIDLAKTKMHCEVVKRMATGKRLQNLVSQQDTAVVLFQRRQASRYLSLQRRQEAAVTNLENLLRIELTKMEKFYRTKFMQSNIDLDDENDDDADDKNESPTRPGTPKLDTPRPPSAPSRLPRGGGHNRRNSTSLRVVP